MKLFTFHPQHCPVVTAWFVLFVLLSFACPLKGQNPRGSQQGEVQDPMGARIASATVSVSNNGMAVERTAQVNSRGEFRINDLPSGGYEVVVHAQGFAEATTEITVVVSSVRDILVTLHPAIVQQGLEVHADGSSITTEPYDPTRTVQQVIVTAQDLHDIPLAARTFANVTYMALGTAPVEPSDPTRARITAVSFGGSSGLNVQLSVDGGDNTDDYIGGFLQNFSPDAIREFAVLPATITWCSRLRCPPPAPPCTPATETLESPRRAYTSS